MMAADMAPGMNRHFLAESWEHLIPKECWEDAREEARERVNLDIETDIQGFDIDAAAIKAARANAKMAGVDKLIHFQQRPVSELRHSKPFGFIVTNPPYGERIEEKRIFRHCTVRSARAISAWIAGPCILSPPMTRQRMISAEKQTRTVRSITE